MTNLFHSFFIMTIIFPILFTYFLSILLMPAMKKAGLTIGAVDLPDKKRHLHKRATVRFGGAGIFLSFFPALLLFCRPLSDSAEALLIGGGVIFLCGCIDDARSLSPLLKFSFQVAAAILSLLVLSFPLEISFLSFSLPVPAVFGFLYGVYRFILYMNGVNFTDGIDGLCAQSSIVALFSFAITFFYYGESEKGLLALLLLSAVLGFLPYNLSPASLFMGDSGAGLIGLSLAVFALTPIGGTLRAETALFLALPTLDTFFSVGRRILNGKSPFRADRGHLHHMLLKAGLSVKEARRVLVVFSMGCAALGLLMLIPA